MKVKKLIKMLEKMPQNAMVVINGYEGGVDEAGTVTKVKLMLDAYNSLDMGRHEIDDKQGKKVAVHIDI